MQLFKGSALATALWVTLTLASSADAQKAIERTSPDREPTNEKEFLIRAISCEVAQVKFAEKAAKNASDENVRKLAQTIVDEHTKLRDNLLQQAKKMKVAVVEGLEKEHRDQYEKMLKLSGAEYDRAYLKWITDSHEKEVKLYSKWAKDAGDSDLRDIASRAVKGAKEHLQQAKKLSRP